MRSGWDNRPASRPHPKCASLRLHISDLRRKGEVYNHENPLLRSASPSRLPAPPPCAGAGSSTRGDGARAGLHRSRSSRSPSMASPTTPSPASPPARCSRQLNLAVDNLTVTGALSSASLNEDDLAAGLYDDAAIEIWRVNWADTRQRVLMRKGNLGQVTRGDAAFQAEMRGLAHVLNQPVGRAYGYACDADLGDARCTVDLSDPALQRRRQRVASATMRGASRSSGSTRFADRLVHRRQAHLDQRRQCGPRHGGQAPRRLRRHRSRIELWQAMSEAVARRRYLHRHRRLRQAIRHLQGEVRQRREFPRLPLHARQRRGDVLSGSHPAARRRQPLWQLKLHRMRRRIVARSRAAGSARPMCIRRASRARAAIAWGCCAACGARLRGEEPEAAAALFARLGRGHGRGDIV